jgi:hypothetical protein
MSEQGAACLANIGPRERRKRLVSGAIILAAGAGLAVALLLLGASRAVRLVLFLPFAGGAVSALQAREKT